MTTASVYDFEATDISGKSIAQSAFRGRVMLVVNTASKCGFTPQFGGLEALHNTYAAEGLTTDAATNAAAASACFLFAVASKPAPLTEIVH